MAIGGLDEQATASLLDQIDSHGAKKRRAIPKPIAAATSADDAAAALLPRTAKEDVVDIMPKLLDDAALARKHRNALAVYGLSDEMRAALADFAKWCDETFQKAQQEALQKKTQEIHKCVWTC